MPVPASPSSGRRARSSPFRSIAGTSNSTRLARPEREEPRRFDCQVGTLIVPPNAWFHQHFNSGPTPARYLAFKHWTPRNAQGVPMSWISTRLGGTQIDYADERPLVRRMFADALARHGVRSRMEEVYAAELPNLPPKAA